MKFETTRFGMIEVEHEDIVIFPEGPLGFPDCTRFTLVEEERSQPFMMLQSLDNPALAFVVVDPLVVRPDYHFNVTMNDLKLIKAEDTDNLVVYCIVTMAKEVADVTVNLQGPLVINSDAHIGHQYVLIDSDYTTREALITSSSSEEQTAPVEPQRTRESSERKAV
ncbi:MAG: flagellar assembly protein FliW [bacterium]|nr:flagellar assembly protein FliW [bacterium]